MQQWEAELENIGRRREMMNTYLQEYSVAANTHTQRAIEAIRNAQSIAMARGATTETFGDMHVPSITTTTNNLNTVSGVNDAPRIHGGDLREPIEYNPLDYNFEFEYEWLDEEENKHTQDVIYHIIG